MVGTVRNGKHRCRTSRHIIKGAIVKALQRTIKYILDICPSIFVASQSGLDRVI